MDNNEIADEQLIAGLLLGEPGAAENFCARFEPLLKAIAIRSLGAAEADDALQNIYIKIHSRDWRVLRLWNKEGSLHAYLARVARNVCNDFRRSENPVPLVIPEPEDDDPAADPQAVTYARELQECLERALGELSETYRRIISLRHYKELTHAEIASELGKTMGYVGPTLQRAENYLRDEMREHCADHLREFGIVVRE